MTPPTFWRRKSLRPPSPQPPPTSSTESASLLSPTPNAGDSSSSIHSLGHASSNATIRIDEHNRHSPRRQSLNSTASLSSSLHGHIHAPDQCGNRSTLYLIILTVSLLGAQMAWSLELSYGTPYLLSLGLSPQLTSLVWLAGPLSGLIAQPVVGCLSDASSSRFRRRYYMLLSTFFILTSTLALAFAEPVSEAVVDLFALGLGDWDPVREGYVATAARTLAVVSFWMLDFALNGLQASGRTLVLDSLKGEEMDSGNAWLGRMTHIGNILGYSAGYLDLSHLRILTWLGGDQFRKFAMIALFGLLLSVGITTSFITESYLEPSTFSSSFANHPEKRGPSFSQRISTLAKDMTDALRRLPRPIRRVCLVQLFAFMGWFPFLFYATTYIGTFEQPGHGRKEREIRERRGTEGMLLFAVLSLVFGIILPLLSLASPRPTHPPSFKARLQFLLLPLLPPYSSSRAQFEGLRGKGLPLRTFWTLASLMYAGLMALTFLVTTSDQAIILVGAVGVSWAVASWVPFTLVMAFVKEAEEGQSRYEFEGDFYSPRRTRERRRSRRESMSGFQTDHRDGVGTEEGETAGKAASSPARNYLREALTDCGGSLVPSDSKGGGSKAGNATRRSASSASASTIRKRSSIAGTSDADSRRSSRLGSGSFIARGAEVLRGQPLGGSLASSSPARGGDGSATAEAEEEGGYGASGGGPETDDQEETKGGTILGIHNVAIVLPQFLISIISSLIFKHFNRPSNASSLPQYFALSSSPDSEGSAPGVVWVLRFGGLAALCAAVLTRFVPLTKAERRNRFGVDEDKEDDDDGEDGEDAEEDDVRTIGE